MIILGDLACPNSDCAEQLIADMRKCGIFKNQLVLCNLEGMIRDDEPYKDEKLFNHSKVLDAFEKDKTVFSLANNHTYDYPEYIVSTQKLLIQNGFYNVGIGEVSPILVESENNKYAVFAHCWSVYTKTNSNTINDVIVTDCDYKTFAEVTIKFAKEHPEVRVVCYFHWNYDMEKIPFPAYRRLAHDLIDGGVYSVIGNHSHVPQGGEIYKNRAIVYGLGNF